jgi:hypothetical protein
VRESYFKREIKRIGLLIWLGRSNKTLQLQVVENGKKFCCRKRVRKEARLQAMPVQEPNCWEFCYGVFGVIKIYLKVSKVFLISIINFYYVINKLLILISNSQ